MHNEKDYETLESGIKALLKYWKTSRQIDDPVIQETDYDALETIFSTLTLESSTKTKGLKENPEHFFDALNTYLEFCTKTNHPLFCDRLNGATSEITVLSSLLEIFSNTTMATYKASTAATVIENKMIQKLCRMTGFSPGDGIFTPGGTFSNGLAVLCARQTKFPDIRKKGLSHHKPLSIFVSDQAHYSFETTAIQQGIGSDYVYKVQTNELGQMSPIELESSIKNSLEKGEQPFFVCATAGTTVTGAFDDLEAINAICKKYQLWFHVDAAYGGSLLFSNKFKSLLTGINLADSSTLDFHKLLGAPIPCSVFLSQSNSILMEACTPITNSGNTDYIFNHKSTHDLGKKSLQCARPADAIKLWLSWLYEGTEGFENRIGQLITLAAELESLISQHKRLKLVIPRQSTNVCFQVLPLTADISIDNYNRELNDRLFEKGHLIQTALPFKDTYILRSEEHHV